MLQHARGLTCFLTITAIVVSSWGLKEAAHAAGNKGIRLAVMPFENSNKTAADPDLQALSSGIPESMIQGLKNISALHLIERENMKHVLKEQTFGQTGFVDAKTAPKIGAILGANILMVGSYEVLGDQLRISARFIKADTGEVLADKAFTVTGKWKDGAFQTMDDLAQKFVASFNVQTSDAEKKVISQTISSTKNYDAYTHYLKGREYFLHFNHSAFNRSIAEYQQALTIDPQYALAEAGVAYTYYYQGFLEEEVGNEYLSYYQQAEQHARRAVDLAPDSVLAHVALARVYLDTERVDDGRREVEAAVRLNPNDPMVRFAAFALHVRDRLQHGGELPSLNPQALAMRLGPELAELQAIKEDNPKDGVVYMFAGYVFAQLGMAREALADLGKAIQLNPNLGTVTHLGLMKLYQSEATSLGGAVKNKHAMDLVNKAVHEAELYQALDKDYPNPVVDLMRVARLVLQKQPAKALPLLQRAFALNPKNKDTLDLAMITYFSLGNRQALLQAVMALAGVLKEEVDRGQRSSAGRLGTLLLQTGYAGQALPYLQAFYEYIPNAETKAQILKAQMGNVRQW